MADLEALRQGVADRIATISGLNASPQVQTNPGLPTAYVVPDSADYHVQMGTGTDWFLIVELQVGMVSDIGGQKLLDKFLSSTGADSIKAAVEGDKTLGGIAEDTLVRGFRDYGMFARAQGDQVLGARISVWVLA